jgi:hypothetical protein
MKKDALAALKAVTGRTGLAPPPPPVMVEKTILIGAHFSPEVRRAVKMLEAHTGKKLKTLLGAMINDWCERYNVPQPYSEEA